jgi:hypothetical protein
VRSSQGSSSDEMEILKARAEAAQARLRLAEAKKKRSSGSSSRRSRASTPAIPDAGGGLGPFGRHLDDPPGLPRVLHPLPPAVLPTRTMGPMQMLQNIFTSPATTRSAAGPHDLHPREHRPQTDQPRDRPDRSSDVAELRQRLETIEERERATGHKALPRSPPKASMPTPTSVTSHYGTSAEDLIDLTTLDPAVAPPRRTD